mmetsp:Transcript_18649/g.32314  ORF Transcript_18649/g.32314 Transcript_18649/m.32314 type:complete len:203 (-) Transcript_18649:456-1064(-)
MSSYLNSNDATRNAVNNGNKAVGSFLDLAFGADEAGAAFCFFIATMAFNMSINSDGIVAETDTLADKSFAATEAGETFGHTLTSTATCTLPLNTDANPVILSTFADGGTENLIAISFPSAILSTATLLIFPPPNSNKEDNRPVNLETSSPSAPSLMPNTNCTATPFSIPTAPLTSEAKLGSRNDTCNDVESSLATPSLDNAA